jgi:hypothetical protein
VEESNRKAEEEEKKRRLQEEKEKEKVQKIKKRKALPEPEPGEGIILILVRLPDGQQIKRRFRGEESFQSVFDIIQTYELKTQHGTLIEKWELLSRYPRKTWNDPELKLKDASLGKQAMFFVQEVI